MKTTIVVVCCLLCPLTANSQEATPDPLGVDCVIDCTLTGISFSGVYLLALIPVEKKPPTGPTFFAFDQKVTSYFSQSAAHASDITLILSMALPLSLQLTLPFGHLTGERSLIYVQTLSISLLLTQAAKYIVQRPRPYTYNQHPQIQRYTASQGEDAYLSFYSGHASTSFAAAVSGAYLYALDNKDSTARAIVWGVQLGLAAMTANLRVRAGKHFYSDVLIGALMGTALGVLIPLLHEKDHGSYRPKTGEWIAMASGLAAGTLLSQVLHYPTNISVPVHDKKQVKVNILPMVQKEGSGLMLAGRF